MPELGLIGPSYTLSSVNADAQKTVNLFAEMNETGKGKSVSMLRGTPGCKRFCTLPDAGGIRAQALWTTSQGRCFTVQNAAFYEIFANGTFHRYGSLLTTAGPVRMAENGLQLVAVDGPYGYVFDLSTHVWTQITTENFYGSSRVDFLDQYLLFVRPDSQQFYFTSLAGTSFDALDFASAEGAPDQLRSLLVTHREIWLFGATSTEVWFDAGDLDHPFQRIAGAFLQQGTAAAQSPCQVGESICWLGASAEGAGIVWQAQGYQPQRISTHAVEGAIAGYADSTDALGWSEQREGHLWYVLTFPSGNATWVYDLTTQEWFEKSYLTPATGELGRHRANAHTFAFGKHLVGDYADGRIYELDASTYTDDGDALKWLRRAPYIAAPDLPYVFHHILQLDLETGGGLDAGLVPGTDPQVMLRWSDNNGHSWGTEHVVSAGQIGETQSRALWRRLGRSRARVYEVSGTDPVKRALLGAHLETEVATA